MRTERTEKKNTKAQGPHFQRDGMNLYVTIAEPEGVSSTKEDEKLSDQSWVQRTAHWVRDKNDVRHRGGNKKKSDKTFPDRSKSERRGVTH